MKKQVLLGMCVAFAMSTAVMADEVEKKDGVIIGTIEKTVESPFTISGWALGKTANMVKASIKSPLRASGYIVTVPGKIANVALDALGDAAEAPGDVAQQVLYALGDNVSEAVAAPLDVARDIVQSPKTTGKEEKAIYDAVAE